MVMESYGTCENDRCDYYTHSNMCLLGATELLVETGRVAGRRAAETAAKEKTIVRDASYGTMFLAVDLSSPPARLFFKPAPIQFPFTWVSP